jgi:hypothetical protein
MLAIGFNPESMPAEEAVDALRTMVTNGIALGMFNPWCGICKSRDFHYEVGGTRFRTMAEAEPHLREIERQNAIARAILGGANQN